MASTQLDKPVLTAVVVGRRVDECLRIETALRDLEEPRIEIVQAPAAAAVDLVVALFEDDRDSATLSAWRDRTPRPALLAVVERPSHAMMKRALRAGADEILLDAADTAHLTRAILKLTGDRQEQKALPRRGQVLSLIGAGGGVGVSTLCANLALGLRKAPARASVALIDLDLQKGSLEVMLDLEPEHGVETLACADPLDEAAIIAALGSHPSGIRLLRAPLRIDDDGLVTPAMLGTTLDLVSSMFDFTIVDCGAYIDDLTVSAWERSARILCVATQSMHSVRCAARLARLFERLALLGAKPEVVVNRFERSHPLSTQLIAETLRVEILATISRDDRALETAQVEGLDVWAAAPQSAVVRDVDALVRTLSAPASIPARPSGGAGSISAAAARVFGGPRSPQVRVGAWTF